jgi:hypothetical protein
VERLASKTARKIYTDKSDKIYDKLVGDVAGQQASDVATGVRKPDLKPKNVMVTMIFFREKEGDPKKEKQKKKEAGEIPVHIDFPKGTSLKEALSEKKRFVSNICKSGSSRSRHGGRNRSRAQHQARNRTQYEQALEELKAVLHRAVRALN